MARIKIDLPSSFSFVATVPVRITDLNYGGHVGNDTILSLIHEARMQFLSHHNFTELNFDGAGLIMSDVAIEYRSEVYYGDVIKAFVSAFDFTRVSFDICYKLVRESDEKIIALAKTGMVCYDYAQKKVVTVPENARKALTD